MGEFSGRVKESITISRMRMAEGEISARTAQAALPRVARLAVLLSGTGRTLENVLRAIGNGELRARVEIVVSSKVGVRGVEIGESAGVPTDVVDRREFGSEEGFSDAVYAVIEPYRPDLIVMAGFLRKLTIKPEFEGRILNIHPALLPESAAAGRGFYGERVHAAVLASGAEISGATVHVVDAEYDQGPVIMRTEVPVLAGDTPAALGARVFAAECALYPRAIQRYLVDHPELMAGD